jgi:SAM-dependent methyltransferase
MFFKSAQCYDLIYAYKDYAAETQRLTEYIHVHLRSSGNRLLDIACGTGHHLQHLREQFQIEGLDLDNGLLEIARQRNPGVKFHLGDMMDFDLGCRYDILTCLFSAIGYVRTLDGLERAIGCMRRHLSPGGVLLIEPWFTPGDWKPGGVYASFIDQPDIKIARINISLVEGRLSYFDFHYLVGTSQGIEHFVERHELGLFEIEEMKSVLANAGLDVIYDPQGISGRGLYIGICTN